MNIVSAGDTLREAAKNEDPTLNSILSQGILVPEHITERYLTLKIEKLCQQDLPDIILEGYPRSPYQSSVVEKWLKRSFGKYQFSLQNTVGFHLLATQDEIIDRLAKRWICPSNGNTYHDIYNPPHKIGFDNDTNEPLEKRTDDLSPNAILNRLETYRKSTLPVIDNLKHQGLSIIDIPSGSIRQVEKMINKQLHLFY